jgi:hypothetical protein
MPSTKSPARETTELQRDYQNIKRSVKDFKAKYSTIVGDDFDSATKELTRALDRIEQNIPGLLGKV